MRGAPPFVEKPSRMRYLLAKNDLILLFSLLSYSTIFSGRARAETELTDATKSVATGSGLQ